MSYNLGRIINNSNYRDELTFLNTADEHKLPQHESLKIYSKPDNNIYKLDDMGVETLIQAGSVVAGGDVYGAPSSIDNAIVLFDGNSG